MEKINPNYKKKRPFIQAIINFDFYSKLLEKNSPDFSTFFTNHVAATMHRYWKDAYEIPQEISHKKNFKNKLIYESMQLVDHQLKELYKFSEKNNFDLAILDDGFQDKSIKKNFNILCFNSNQLIGNGLVFPSGPLREGLSSIKRANVVVINGKKDNSFEKKINNVSKNIEIFYSNYEPINIKEFQRKRIFAFAGIGNPENFFKMLVENDIDLQKK